MTRSRVVKAVLISEIFGVSAIIVLLWLDELFDLPHRFFGAEPTPVNWRECLVESIAVALLGAMVVAWSARLLARIKYLEGFLPVCRFCRKIRIGDEWISLATYMTEHWEQTVSEGTCPECGERFRIVQEAQKAQVRREN